MKNHIFEHKRSGDLVRVEEYIKNGGDIDICNGHGETLLHLSILCRYPDIFDFLMVSGADVNKAKPSGKAPLHSCANHGLIAFGERLIKAGVDIDKVDTYGNMAICVAMERRHDNFVILLLKNNAKFEASKYKEKIIAKFGQFITK